MKIRGFFHIKRTRKYPIKRDEKGLSLRARCFALFDQGKRPVEVAVELKAKEATVFRYFHDWKRHGPNFDLQYAYVKNLFSKTSPDRDKNLEQFSKLCGVSKEEFEAILSTPHGLRRFLTGRLYFPIQANADHKRSVSLKIAVLMSDHLVKTKGYFEDIYYALERYFKLNKRIREEEEADISEDNELMKLIHAVLAVDLENERKGLVKPDKLSEEERDALIKYGIESERKKTEIKYWINIGCLMADGLTKEQARERIYQGVVQGGDPKRAETMREFQDKIDPLKPTGPVEPPPSSSES